MSRVVWVLNLDADVELAATDGYQPTNAVRAAMAPHVARLAASLLAPGDVLVDETSAPGIARGLVGRAFCPTPRALAILLRAGAEPEAHPSREVLRTVNGRAFCASLGQTLPGSAFVRDLDAAIAHLEGAPTIADRWRVKRAFGMAGRGQRVVVGGAKLEDLDKSRRSRSLGVGGVSPLVGAEPQDSDRAFLRAGIREGGIQIEPNVAIVCELAQHGVLVEDGSLRKGRLVVQECDARGQWLATRIATDADEVDDATRTAIANEVERVAAALHAANYFGPFGVDAFLYRARDGMRALQPRSEINARYSMGFAVGFGLRAPDA